MPIPIPVAVRRQIVEGHKAGQTLRQLSQALSIPYESVRNVWRVYRDEGRIEPNYQKCGVKGPKVSRRVYRGARFLRYLHPTWGAPLIRQVLREKWPEEPIPDARSLQRWFKRLGLHRPVKPSQGEVRIGRGKAPHNIWEMDSREGIKLGNEQSVVWLLTSDEASGAVLEGDIFPSGTCQSSEC